jgi:hypothetical protein
MGWAGAVALGLLVVGCGGDSSSHPSTFIPVPKQKNGLWVANSGGPNVLEFLTVQTPAGTRSNASKTGTEAVINNAPELINASGAFDSPQDTLFDSAENLWVVDGAGQGVFEFTNVQLQNLGTTNNPAPAFAITNVTGVPGFVAPQFAVFDAAGDLYVEDTGANLIDAFTAAQLTSGSGAGLAPACVFSSTDFGPLGAVFDSSGNLFVAQNGGTTIVRINAADLSLTNPACSPGPVALVYANRRRIRGARGRRLMRQRGERIERSFAHLYDTGGMRRTHLRGHANILKRLLIHAGGSAASSRGLAEVSSSLNRLKTSHATPA